MCAECTFDTFNTKNEQISGLLLELHRLYNMFIVTAYRELCQKIDKELPNSMLTGIKAGYQMTSDPIGIPIKVDIQYHPFDTYQTDVINTYYILKKSIESDEKMNNTDGYMAKRLKQQFDELEKEIAHMRCFNAQNIGQPEQNLKKFKTALEFFLLQTVDYINVKNKGCNIVRKTHLIYGNTLINVRICTSE
jgi:hypothetical protein